MTHVIDRMRTIPGTRATRIRTADKIILAVSGGATTLGLIGAIVATVIAIGATR